MAPAGGRAGGRGAGMGGWRGASGGRRLPRAPRGAGGEGLAVLQAFEAGGRAGGWGRAQEGAWDAAVAAQSGGPAGALRDPRVLGPWEVAHTSQGPAQGGAPAGGKFMGPVGRALFRPSGLAQNLSRSSGEGEGEVGGGGVQVLNFVKFRLLGLVPGQVSLRGDLSPKGPPVAEREIRKGATSVDLEAALAAAGPEGWAEVLFDRPRLWLWPGLCVQLGPPSSVLLQTPYVDNDVRLGLGSRGSRFVFRRGGAGADPAAEARARQPPRNRLGALLLLAMGSALAQVIVGIGAPGRWAGGALLAIFAGLAYVLWGGGTVPDAEGNTFTPVEEEDVK